MSTSHHSFSLQHWRHERPSYLEPPPVYSTEHTRGVDQQSYDRGCLVYSPSVGYSPPLPSFSCTPNSAIPEITGSLLAGRLSQRMSMPATEYKSSEESAQNDRTLDAEEKEMLKRGMFNWTEIRRWRFWIRKEWWGWYIILAVCVVVVTLMTLYNKQIIHWMRPFADKLKSMHGGWTIPIGVLFVISFPPLFGHEIIMILCGVVWGLWFGFLVVCIGIFLGEMGNFYAFKTCFRSRAAQFERKNMNYALLAHVVREGGLKIAVMARLSAIPGHFTTVVFSTCGMSVGMFAIGTILSLPKNLAIVYLGVALGSTDESPSSKTVEYTVIAISFLFSILAAWYIYWYMNKSRLIVWRLHRANLEKEGDRMEEIPGNPTEYDVSPECEPRKCEGEANMMNSTLLETMNTTMVGNSRSPTACTCSPAPGMPSKDLPLYPFPIQTCPIHFASHFSQTIEPEGELTTLPMDSYSVAYPQHFRIAAFPQPIQLPPISETCNRALSNETTIYSVGNAGRMINS